MGQLDVLQLASQINLQSMEGELAEDLLRTGNDLFEATHESGKLRRIRPNGEVSEGRFHNDFFIIEKVLDTAEL